MPVYKSAIRYATAKQTEMFMSVRKRTPFPVKQSTGGRQMLIGKLGVSRNWNMLDATI